ncbi:hypothetical protein AVE30378_06174 [Achromobacter veterisilvae]|uniref:Uncharacterized protein n=1 Tax=Achromobacter veterisilvae TaxID=2069367 RepID=A0A446D181_9BURK|nr:hypothetical protein AVE30378_06174 [Achromobacter veterisilvae]
MAGAEDVHVLVERAFDGRLVPEGDEVQVVDVRLGRMLDALAGVQLVAHDQAHAGQFGAVVGRNPQVAAGQIDDAEVVAAPDDVGRQFAVAGQFHGNVLRGHVRRHVLEARPQHVVAFGCHFRHDQAGGGFEADLGNAVLAARHQAVRDHGHADGDRAVAAHVRVLGAVDVDQAGVVFRAGRRREEHAEHILVPAGLAHQGLAQPVVVLFQERPLFQDGGSGRIGNAAVHDAQGLAFGMGIDDIERVLLAHDCGSRQVGKRRRFICRVRTACPARRSNPG